MSYEQNIDFVLRTVEERDIRFIRLWFTDVLGNLKSLAISPEDLEEVFEEGIGFDGSAVDGFVPLQESDMLAFPDPETFQLLPWRADESSVARMFCDIKTPSGEPFAGDSRSRLDKVFRDAEKLGYILNVGAGIEYFYLKDNVVPQLLDHAGYFDLTPFDYAQDLRRSTTLALEKMSIPVEYSFHSLAPSQNGIQLRYAEACTCADNILTARLLIKEAAHYQGHYASFMPKPFTDIPGSALFVNQSLMDHEGNNLFYEENSANGVGLSDLAKHYIAGILKYAPEFSLITNPSVNSYKRLVPHGEVPCYTTWGRKNRAALVRIPIHKPNKPSATRIELRSPDPTCNPYLAFAVTLAAGMRGIKNGLELPDEATIEDIKLSEEQLRAKRFNPLPRDLGEALARFEKSTLMREALGEHIFTYLLNEKKREWEEYRLAVTDWEQKRYYAGF